MFQPWTGTPRTQAQLIIVTYVLFFLPSPPLSARHPISTWGGYLLTTRSSLPFTQSCIYTGSFAYLGVICIRPSMVRLITPCIRLRLRYLPASPSLPQLPYLQRRSLTASKISSNIALSCFRAAVCRHHGSWLSPPPFYTVPLSQISSIGMKATYSATVACRLSIYAPRDWFPVSLRTFDAASIR